MPDVPHREACRNLDDGRVQWASNGGDVNDGGALVCCGHVIAA